MGRPLSIIWRGLVDVYGELFPMVGMNLLWLVPTFVLASLVSLIFMPFAAGALEPYGEAGPFLYSGTILALTVIVPNPAAAGIHNFANLQAKEERVEFALFWEGLRQYWAKALLLWAIGVGVLAMLIGNVVFYLSRDGIVWNLIGLIWIWAIVVWLSMQLYALPLLIEQNDKKIRYIYRNAAILAVDNPFTSVALLVILLVLTFVSIGIAIFIALVTGSLVAVVEHRACLTLLEKYQARSRKQAS